MPKAKAKAKAKAAHVAAPPAPALAPVGRMPDFSMDVMRSDEWYASMLVCVQIAHHIIIGSYQFDHGDLTNALLHRLNDRYAFELVLLVDQEMYAGKVLFHQRPRLELLRRAGAEIVRCRGTPSTGSFHAKALVADRRTAFVGSANFTGKSTRNGELCFRVRGPPVVNILQYLENERALGKVVV